MTPTRILPDLQCSVLCEDVRQEASGNFILVGVINFLRLQQVPAGLLKLMVFNRWTAGYGQFVETVRLLAPDQTTVLCKSEMRFALPDVARNTTTVSVWSPVKFEAAGDYYVEVMVDDVMKLRYPLSIIVPEQRPQTGPPKEP
jgi:hypothetical protein